MATSKTPRGMISEQIGTTLFNEDVELWQALGAALLKQKPDELTNRTTGKISKSKLLNEVLRLAAEMIVRDHGDKSLARLLAARCDATQKDRASESSKPRVNWGAPVRGKSKGS